MDLLHHREHVCMRSVFDENVSVHPDPAVLLFMLSRLFEGIGQSRWVHELRAVCMFGCIHVNSVIFEADMASDFVGATCNGWAAK